MTVGMHLARALVAEKAKLLRYTRCTISAIMTACTKDRLCALKAEQWAQDIDAENNIDGCCIMKNRLKTQVIDSFD